MTIEHVDIGAGERHEPKGISTATADQVYISDGAESGAWTNYAAGFQNIKEVTSVDDFPAPVANVITPESNTAYFISGPVNIAPNVINITNPGVALLGFNRATDALITNSTSPLISSSNQNIPLTAFTLINLNPAGDLINLSNSGSSVVILDKMFFGECGNIGNIGNFQNIIFDNCGINSTPAVGGITFSGTSHTEVLVRDSFFSNWTGTMFDLTTATSMFIEFAGTRFVTTTPANIAISGLPSAGNIQVGGLGTISTCLFSGMTSPLNGLDHADSGWFFTDVVGIQASDFIGYFSMAGNATPTIISTTNVWEKVAGVTVPNTANERFSQTADNELQADVLLDRPVDLKLSLSAGKVGGGNRILEFTIFKDTGSGFSILDSNVIATLETDDKVRGVSLFAIDVASPGDKYSVYCRNTTDTANVEVPNLQFEVRG